MPYPVNQARRHPFPKARYQVSNWREYGQALQERGSLTVWVTPEAIAAWQAPPTGQRGRSPFDSNLAIETGHLWRLALGRPWRQTSVTADGARTTASPSIAPSPHGSRHGLLP
jgi:Transposase DDE domain